MQHAAARSASNDNASHRAAPSGNVIPITLGVQRRTTQRHRVTLRELFLSIVSASEQAAPLEPIPVTASANPTLLLTEADFAPPEGLLPLILRIAAFAVLASACGAAAQFALALIP
jgi:hypothetical protein